MDIAEFIQSNNGMLNNIFSNFFNSQCIVCGNVIDLSVVERGGYDAFSLFAKKNMPIKLYKYFSNREENGINFSIQALENNTVYLQSPLNFDDCFDSDIWIDYPMYERKRLFEYCKRSGIHVSDNVSTSELKKILVEKLDLCIKQNKNLDLFFVSKDFNELESLSNDIFIKSIIFSLQKGNNIEQAVLNSLIQEYNDFIGFLKTVFRISCFSITPYSQLMWGGHYADSNKGFCVEYTILPDDDKYKSVYLNLFPLLYCKKRSDVSDQILEIKNRGISSDDMWKIYFHGTLRKSVDWAFQNEWRLLLPNSKDLNYNIDFFPITKVFLGNQMTVNNRKRIIDICTRKNIPYVGVKKNPNIFELEDCETKCENCPNYFLKQ